MRRIARTLAVAGAVLGMGLTALPATAGVLSLSPAAGQGRTSQARTSQGRTPSPAQTRALDRAKRVGAALSKRGEVTGVVRGPSGAPQADVCVQAIGAIATRTAFTRANGRFIIAGLPLGEYRIEYRGCSAIGRFVGQWYGGLTRAAATQVLVTGGAPARLAPVELGMISPQFTRPATTQTPGTTGQNLAARLAAALVSRLRSGHLAGASVGRLGPQASNSGHISGVVTGQAGRPVQGVCVLAIQSGARSLDVFGEATTKSGGYTMRVRPGRYLIDFLPTCASTGNYAPQLWRAAGSAATATALHVSARQRITHIDAALSAGALIKGRVHGTTAAKHPLGGLCVIANGIGDQRYFVALGRTRPNGAFRMANLATGRYRLTVNPVCNPRTDFLATTLRTPVTVTDGKTTTGISIAVQLGGTISGHVRNTGGHGLTGICAYAVGDGHGYFGQTGAKGNYRIGGLPTGKYHVNFALGCGNHGAYVPVAVKGTVTVMAGKTTAGVNAVMALAGSIAGVVKNMGGQPVAGVCVAATGSGGNFGFATTSAAGTYQIKHAAAGNYQVEFIPGGAFSNCGSKGNYLPLAESTTVTSGAASTLDAVLPTGGVMTGVVTGAQGKPVAGICVFSTGQSFFANQIVTKADGSYRMDQLFTGSYDVGFNGGCGNAQSVAPQAYRGDPTFLGPRPVSITQGQVTPGIDARMHPGGTISGQVTDQSGHAVPNACVFIEAITGAGGDGDFADFEVSKHGHYRSTNLPPGQYDVIFSGAFTGRNGCGQSAFADQQFMGRNLGTSPDLVSVPGGAVTGGVNATLAPAGQISGVVRTKAGRPVPGICVTATDPATLAQGETGTGRHGRYVLPDLPAGRYQVEFTNCGSAAFFFGSGLDFANQWYNGKSAQGAANTVIVRAGTTTPGIDAALTPGGSIAGQVVYRPDHRPVSSVCVLAFTPGFSSIGEAITDRRGNYVVTGLSGGDYVLEFAPCVPESALAGQVRVGEVHVTVGQTVRGIGAKLQVGGSISGQVSYAGTAAAIRHAPGTCVEVLPLSATGLGNAAFAGLGGSYQVSNLAPGPYRVLFGDPACSSTWPTLAQKQSGVIYVTARTTTADVDAVLNRTGGIAGLVSGPSGRAVGGICAEAQHALGGPVTVLGVSGKHGYQIAGLQPGVYKVKFTAGCGTAGFATRWYKGARTMQGGTDVLVKPGQVSVDINVTLPRG